MNIHIRTSSRGINALHFLTAAMCVARSAMAAFLELSPGNAGDFTYVESPTPSAVAELRAAGKRPLVEANDFADEAAAFTNWAETASAVAFLQMPRRHLIHSWKSLGVTVLKTVRFQPEGSAVRFRREASFIAFQGGADGIWLPDSDNLPPGWREALAEAREDWRILLYLKSLADEAAQSDDFAVRMESRRVAYWFGWMPASWENIDTLRLECVVWARRLEELLGKPRASLPEKRASPSEPQVLAFMPYSDAVVKPEQKPLPWLKGTLVFDGGLSFKADRFGFELSYTTSKGPALAKDQLPGGTLDFRVYIQGDKPGEFLPYRFHCDLNPEWYGDERAPYVGEGLFSIDERFRPFSNAIHAHNTRVWTSPVLRDFGPDYPNPQPSVTVTGNKGGGWTATVSVKWVHLFGHWPMQRAGKSDLWFVGLDRAPDTGKALSGRILWPRGSPGNFKTLAALMSPVEMTKAYNAELGRTQKIWTTAHEERLYPYAKTATPSFNRYDVESDRMFWERLVEPLCITNQNAWDVIYADLKHLSKLPAQPDAVKMSIWSNYGRMCYLSHEVGLRRLSYLEGRLEGREPPPAPKKAKTAEEVAAQHKAPDADYDPDSLQLDEKEF